jgi:hypothetical protein
MKKIGIYICPLLFNDTVTGMSVKRCLEVSRSFARNPIIREKKGNAIYEKGKAEIHNLAYGWSSGTDIPWLGINGDRTKRYVVQ